MNILNLIQTSNITTIGYTTINEKIVQQHLESLDGSLVYFPTDLKKLGEILEDSIEFQREWNLNLILNKGKKVFYILDLTQLKFPEINGVPNSLLNNSSVNPSQYLLDFVRSFIREISSRFYHLKNENIEISIIILQDIYNSFGGFQYGIVPSSELVIIFSDEISVKKSYISNETFQINRIEYIRDFYINQLTS